ncbi:MAG: TonB family protein [Acidobacteria bacterium]|nr:TonB family protein [Acidobacteriota bacterium]
MAAPAVPKREEPAPPAAAPKPEPRVTAPPAAPKREEPAPPPRPEARSPVPSVVARREAPPSAPPLTPRPDGRAPVSPAVEKRETPAPLKTEGRPSVPMSPVKRDEPAPSKPDVRAVAPAGVAKREEPAPPPKPEARAVVPAAVAKREEVKPAPAPVRPEPATSAPKKEEPAAPVAARWEDPPLLGTPPEELPSRVRWYLIAAALAVALIGTGGYLYMRSGGGSPSASTAADAAGLALRVERNAGQLLLSWNREATVIRTAQKAVLSISDGDHREDVDLDLGQLRSGSIVYSPITNDVSFRLDVVDAKGKNVNESVRVIAGRPSPVAPLGQATPARQESAQADSRTRPEPAPAPAAATRAPAEVADGPSPTPGGGAEPPVPAKPAPQTTPTRAESLAARLSIPPNLPEPPGLEGVTTPAARPAETPSTPPPLAAQIPKPTPQQSAPSQPAPAPAASPDPQPAAAAPQPATTPAQPAAAPPQDSAPSGPLRVGGNVQQAKVMREVTPVYPPLARQARVSGVVRVEATVGRDGRIVRVQALSGPPLLRQAAVDAVRQWVYRPTLLNGQPVDVITQVDVTFNLNR